MRYRIPADPRRNQIRKRAQAALFRRAMSRTMSRTNYAHCCAQTVCNAAQGPQLFRRAVCVQCGARPAAHLSCNRFAMPRTIRCPTRPLKSYNRMQMQLASNSVLSQPPLAAMPQLSEKPRQGFATKKTAWKPAPNVCNFTVTLGLRATVVENGVRKTYSARYYNPQTGRFLSRDPEEGNSGEPKKLHKYLYAYGNPVNRLDPTGRASIGEFLGIVEDFLNNILINLEITTVPRIGAWRVLGAVGGLVGLAASVSKNIYCLGEELNDLINSVPQTPEKALACHEDEDEGGENE